MSTISERRIFGIIGSLYDIAQQTSSEPWVGAYSEMADLFSSGYGGLTAFDRRAETFSVIEGTTPSEFLEEYFNEYQHISPLRPKIAAIQAGERFNRQEMIGDGDFRKLPIYQEFYKRGEIFHLEYRVFLHHEDSHAGISFSRPDGRNNFSENERRAMTYLMPHLARAFKLHFNLLDVQRHNRVIAEAFDHIPQGVIVINRSKKLVFANARGSDFLNRSDAIKLDASGAISSVVPNRAFDRLIVNMFDRSAFPADRFGGVAAIERGPGRRSLEVLIAPFSHDDFRGEGTDELAIIFVTDPEATVIDVSELLMQMYGLTRTEANLAAKLVEGLSFAEACDVMSITQNTGRTHLKRIFSKTGTNRQAALVKLILGGSVNFRLGQKNFVA